MNPPAPRTPRSRLRPFEVLAQDLRYALRMMRRSPGFTLVALLSLGFGIGTNTAIFSIVDALLLKSLPVANAERLVVLRRQAPNRSFEGNAGSLFSYRMFRQIADSSAICKGVFALTYDFTAVVRTKSPAGNHPPSDASDLPETAKAQLVSGNFFSTLEVAPALGRLFTAEEDVPPLGHPVAVLSNGYWRRRFAADRAAIGSTVVVNGFPLTVVGVLPAHFNGVFVDVEPDVYLPLTVSEAVHYSGNSQSMGNAQPGPIWGQPLVQWVILMARRQPGVSLAQANAALDLLLHRELRQAATALDNDDDRRDLLAQHLVLSPGFRGLSQLRDRLTQPLVILLVLAGLVLLIACANVANLLLARADRRRKEMAVRLGVGAARSRLIRQLLTESLLLAGCGGLLGLLFGFWGSRFLYTLIARPEVPIQLTDALDLRKLAAAAAIAMATGLLFGLAPALLSTRVELSTVLKDAARSVAAGSGGRPGRRLPLGRVLVAAQIGISLVLLVGAGLFVRSLQNLTDVDPGFSRDGLLRVQMNPRVLDRSDPQLLALYRNLTDRVGSLPGVRSASVSLAGLFSGSSRSSNLALPSVDERKAHAEEVYTDVSLVSPGYFETIGIPILQGRPLTAHDREGAAPVAVINQTMARRFFPHGDAVGRRFGFGDPKNQNDFEIVGVAKDTKYNTLREDTPLMVYRSVFEDPDVLDYLFVRTEPGRTGPVAAHLRQVIAEVEPQLPILDVVSMHAVIDRSVGRDRAIARLSGFFGALALLLAALGLYGVMSYAVARRTNEIGVRMALGARPAKVLQLMLVESLEVIVIGAVAGLLAAYGLSRYAAGQLFGLKADDPATLIGATVVLVVLAFAAGYLPARRAAATDPMAALRHE